MKERARRCRTPHFHSLKTRRGCKILEARRPCHKTDKRSSSACLAAPTNRFVEVRYGHNNEALPTTIQQELPELNQVRRCLGSLGRLLCVATLDQNANLADDVACDSGGCRRGVDDGASSVRLRAFQRNGLRRPHGYAELFLPWCPCARCLAWRSSIRLSRGGSAPRRTLYQRRGPPRPRHARRVPRGGLAGAFQASVHRVRGGSEKRVSTPLLVRADLRSPGMDWRHHPCGARSRKIREVKRGRSLFHQTMRGSATSRPSARWKKRNLSMGCCAQVVKYCLCHL